MAKRLVDRRRVNHRAFLKLCEEAASATTAATIKAGRLPPAAVGRARDTVSPSSTASPKSVDGNSGQVTVGQIVTTGASSLNVRSGPSTNNGVVSKLTQGTTAKVTAIAGGWAFVEIGTKTGWVSAKYLKAIP
jgi:uncharacterized protein YgiM (DUF1202 family)